MLRAGDTTAKLLTLAHSDPDYKLYLPPFELIINMFPSLPEHLTALSSVQSQKSCPLSQ